MKCPTILICMCCLLLLSLSAVASSPEVMIVPQPLRVDMHAGSFKITAKTGIVLPGGADELNAVARLLSEQLRTVTGYPFLIEDAGQRGSKGQVTLRYNHDKNLGSEGYVVTVTRDGIVLEAAGTSGFFYAAQTLLQLLPPEAFALQKSRGVRWSVPCVTITDFPRYPWRGMMLDVCRHFFPKEFVKKFIDYLAMHKMNTFHWHLTDDQGWRIEIKGYPLLTAVGAWRVDREDINWNIRPAQRPGETPTYGGFYTQEDIKDVIAYATAHNITIVPEIEMPAHATAVISAYPGLSCTGGPFTLPPGGIWPIKDILCAGNDSTFELVRGVLTEVAALFPGQYIHIGGDEANKTEWKRCPKCQARIKAEHLADEAELQSYFTRRVEGILKDLHKRLIGWDEILEGGLAEEATVMSWRGLQGGIAAARQQHDVVMAPTSNCYFDYYQGHPSTERVAIGGYIPLQMVYTFEPTPDSLTAIEAKHILGTQANLWTEFIPDPEKVEYMVFPRIAAIAEVGWSARERRDWTDFTKRLNRQMDRYAARGINAAKSTYTVMMSDSFSAATSSRHISMQSQIGQGSIRYTLNGKDPRPGSAEYRRPIVLTKEAMVKAALFIDGKRAGPVSAREFSFNRPGTRVVSLLNPFDRVNPGVGESGLTDNLRGTIAPPRNWYRIQQKDLEAVVDLGAPRRIRKLTTGFQHNSQGRAFLPVEVVYSVSRDGEAYEEAARVFSKTSPKEMREVVEDFSAWLPVTPLVRYVKVHARNLGTCPDWHLAAGQPVWLSVDEIVIE